MSQDEQSTPATDFSKVLVVAKSPINRIVMAKIVEGASLGPVVETPETAAAMLRSLIPGAIILDGGVDNKDCDALTPAITTARRIMAKALPAVILLSNRIGTPDSLDLPEIVDEVVAKPITPEKLQPVIERLIALVRD